MLQYPQVKYIRGSGLSFRETPSEVRYHFDESKPFYLLCGQSPQSATFLEKLGKLYKPKSIVCSGYKTRHDYIVSIGKATKNRIVDFTNIVENSPQVFEAKDNEVVTHFPYILDFWFYDKYLKADKYKNRFEFYPKNLITDGGSVYYADNPISLSELDYKEELPELFESIKLLIKNDYSL